MLKSFVDRLLLVALLLGLAAVASAAQQKQDYKGYARGGALITAKELKQLIDANDPKLVIVAAQNEVEYRLGHVPGSWKVDRPEYEAPPETQKGVTGNLIDAPGFTKLAQRLGINKDSKVVVFDNKYDATRLWWAFLYYGKTDVRVLDGGMKAWKDSGYDTALLAPETTKTGSFVAKVAYPSLRAETSDIVALQGGKKGQLWDQRDDKEFCGEDLKKGAFRKGRIPWGQHAEWTMFKKKENVAEWLPANDAKALLNSLKVDPGKHQYFFCQSGVRSTQALFTFYLLGWSLDKLHNYDSSWIGWSKDASLPILSGCTVAPTVATMSR